MAQGEEETERRPAVRDGTAHQQCVEIIERLAEDNGGQIPLRELKMLVKLLDHNLIDTPIGELSEQTPQIKALCIAGPRGQDLTKMATHLAQAYNSRYIDMMHQFMGLGAPPADWEPSEPGLYKVSWAGGIRYRSSPSMRDLAGRDTCFESAPFGMEFTVEQFVEGVDGAEYAKLQDSNFFLPVRMNSGEPVIELVRSSSFEQSQSKWVHGTIVIEARLPGERHWRVDPRMAQTGTGGLPVAWLAGSPLDIELGANWADRPLPVDALGQQPFPMRLAGRGAVLRGGKFISAALAGQPEQITQEMSGSEHWLPLFVQERIQEQSQLELLCSYVRSVQLHGTARFRVGAVDEPGQMGRAVAEALKEIALAQMSANGRTDWDRRRGGDVKHQLHELEQALTHPCQGYCQQPLIPSEVPVGALARIAADRSGQKSRVKQMSRVAPLWLPLTKDTRDRERARTLKAAAGLLRLGLQTRFPEKVVVLLAHHLVCVKIYERPSAYSVRVLVLGEPVQTGPAAGAQAPAAPGEWKQVKSANGKLYYWNTRTNETSWSVPAGMQKQLDADVKRVAVGRSQ